jgi:hypothetical protein
MNKGNRTKILWVFLFAVAMGMLESAVVIYLREIYYPNGFHFPLKAIQGKLAWTEIIREAATLLMLVSVGVLTGKTFIEKICLFYLFICHLGYILLRFPLHTDCLA